MTRSFGPVRKAGSREGLTKIHAEGRLRELMTETNFAPAPLAERLTLGEAGSRLIRQLALKGRKSSTTESYESYLRVHIEPRFGETPIAQVKAEDIEGFVEACLDRGLSVKSALNYLGFLHGIFDSPSASAGRTSTPATRSRSPSAPALCTRYGGGPPSSSTPNRSPKGVI